MGRRRTCSVRTAQQSPKTPAILAGVFTCMARHAMAKRQAKPSGSNLPGSEHLAWHGVETSAYV
jgi:hypothetical protein